MRTKVDCHLCDGQGWIDGIRCYNCDGFGFIEIEIEPECFKQQIKEV